MSFFTSPTARVLPNGKNIVGISNWKKSPRDIDALLRARVRIGGSTGRPVILSGIVPVDKSREKKPLPRDEVETLK